MDFLVPLVGRTFLNLKTFLDGTEMMEDSLYEGQIRYIPEEVKEDKNFVEKIVYVSPIRHAEGNFYLSQILAYPEMYEQMLQMLKEYDEDIMVLKYLLQERDIENSIGYGYRMRKIIEHAKISLRQKAVEYYGWSYIRSMFA